MGMVRGRGSLCWAAGAELACLREDGWAGSGNAFGYKRCPSKMRTRGVTPAGAFGWALVTRLCWARSYRDVVGIAG